VRVERVALADVHRDPANLRKRTPRNLEAIRASLARFGQQRPILVDGRGVILAGNGTHEAAESLGWAEIDVVRTDLTGPDAVGYAIADNRSAELARWEKDPLGRALASLRDDAGLRAALGFSGRQIDRLVAGADGPVEPFRREHAAEDSPRLAAFLEARRKGRARSADKGETNFWVALVFQGYAQKTEFLRLVSRVPVLHEAYVDGEALAAALGLAVTPCPEAPFEPTVERKLKSLALTNDTNAD
jgi:ParB-like chromosome segregation protein Spo0J